MKIFCTIIAWAVGILFYQFVLLPKRRARQKTTQDLSEICACLNHLTETQKYLVEMTKYNLSMARIQCQIQQKQAHDYETAAQLQNIINDIDDLLNQGKY